MMTTCLRAQKNRLRTARWALLSVAAALTVGKAAAEPPTVAFLGVVGGGFAEEENRQAVQALVGLTEIGLFPLEAIRVVERSELARILRERKLAVSGLMNVKQCIEVAGLLRADVVAYLTADDEQEDQRRVRLHVVDTHTGAIRLLVAHKFTALALETSAANIARDIHRTALSDKPYRFTVAVAPLARDSRFSRYDFLSVGICSRLVHELARFPSLRVLERASADLLSREDWIEASGADSVAGVEVGERQAHYLIRGSYKESAAGGNSVAIEIILLDGKSGASVWSQQRECPLDEWGDACSTFAGLIADQLALRAVPVPSDRQVEAETLFRRALWRLSGDVRATCVHCNGAWLPLLPKALRRHVKNRRKPLPGGRGAAIRELECVRYLRPDDALPRLLLANLLKEDVYNSECEATFERAMAILDPLIGQDSTHGRLVEAIRLELHFNMFQYYYRRLPEEQHHARKVELKALCYEECMRLKRYAEAIGVCCEHVRLGSESSGESARLELQAGSDQETCETVLDLCGQYLRESGSRPEREFFSSKGNVIFDVLYLAMPRGKGWKEDAIVRRRCAALLAQYTNSPNAIVTAEAWCGLAAHTLQSGDFTNGVRYAMAGLDSLSKHRQWSLPARESKILLPDRVLRIVNLLARTCGAAGQYAEQASVLKKAASWYKKRYVMEETRSAYADMLGRAYVDSGQVQEACRLYEEQLAGGWLRDANAYPRILWGADGGPAQAIPQENPDFVCEWHFSPNTPFEAEEMLAVPGGIWLLHEKGKGAWLEFFDVGSLEFTRYLRDRLRIRHCGFTQARPRLAAQGTRLYLADYGVGLREYNVETGEWRILDTSSGLPSVKVSTVLAAGDALYVGFNDSRQGAVASRQDDGSFLVYEQEHAPAGPVVSLALAGTCLWVGTRGKNNASVLDRTTGKWRAFGSAPYKLAASRGSCFLNDHRRVLRIRQGSWSVKSARLRYARDCLSRDGIEPFEETRLLPWAGGFLFGAQRVNANSCGIYFCEERGKVHGYGLRDGICCWRVPALCAVGRDVWAATDKGLLRLRPVHEQPVTNSPPTVWCDWPGEVVRALRQAAARGGYAAASAVAKRLGHDGIDGQIAKAAELLRIMGEDPQMSSGDRLKVLSGSVCTIGAALHRELNAARRVSRALGKPDWACGRIPPLSTYAEIVGTFTEGLSSDSFPWKSAGMVFETAGQTERAIHCYKIAARTAKNDESRQALEGLVGNLQWGRSAP